jgi:HD-GYP domain-containing protein (c-di-GMP phosphodiesterase class II)
LKCSKAARIVAVADLFDDLTHERLYKPAWPVPEAVGEIVGHAGRHLDPDVVEVFLRLDHAALLSRVSEPERGLERQRVRSRALVRQPG